MTLFRHRPPTHRCDARRLAQPVVKKFPSSQRTLPAFFVPANPAPRIPEKPLDILVFSIYIQFVDIRNKALVARIFEFIDRILFIEKRTTFEFRGVKLYPSEIHLILFIHRGEDTNVTRMAEQLGVTKGAISQTLTRLERKGILHKIKDPYKKNELTVEFLPFGQKILDHHLQEAGMLKKQYDEYLSTLSKAEREVIKKFLAHADEVMSKHMENKG